MENFSYWQMFLLIGIVLTLVLLARWRFGTRKRSGVESDQQKTACYRELPPLLNQYVDLMDQLAHEYRFAFNHADRLTVESEETAEAIIGSLDQVEAGIKAKTGLLSLLNETELAERINRFLLQEPNKRHSSPKDLEKFTVQARHEARELVRDLQQKINTRS
jgi:hypothetical protein